MWNSSIRLLLSNSANLSSLLATRNMFCWFDCTLVTNMKILSCIPAVESRHFGVKPWYLEILLERGGVSLPRLGWDPGKFVFFLAYDLWWHLNTPHRLLKKPPKNPVFCSIYVPCGVGSNLNRLDILFILFWWCGMGSSHCFATDDMMMNPPKNRFSRVRKDFNVSHFTNIE